MVAKQDTINNASFLPRTAVLIDGDWLIFASRKLEKHLEFRKLFIFIMECFGRNALVQIYLSVDEQNLMSTHFVSELKDIGYSVQAASVAQLMSDCINLCFSRQFDRLVLISGDNDFVPLLNHAKKKGKSTVLLALPFATGKTLQAIADYFANVDDFLAEHTRIKEVSQSDAKQPVEPYMREETYVKRGENLEAYIFFRNLFTNAKQHITIVDPYIDHQILLMVSSLDKAVSVKILTNRIQASDFCNMVQKARLSGYTIEVFKTEEFHDRFLGVDEQWWHSGHSFKDLGSKDSLISKLTDQETIDKVYQRTLSAISSATQLCV